MSRKVKFKNYADDYQAIFSSQSEPHSIKFLPFIFFGSLLVQRDFRLKRNLKLQARTWKENVYFQIPLYISLLKDRKVTQHKDPFVLYVQPLMYRFEIPQMRTEYQAIVSALVNDDKKRNTLLQKDNQRWLYWIAMHVFGKIKIAGLANFLFSRHFLNLLGSLIFRSSSR